MIDDVPKKRSVGRPRNAPVAVRAPAYTRRHLEEERAELQQAEAELEKRRLALIEREEKQRIKCANLLGERVMALAPQDPIYMDICAKLVGWIESPDDRALVISWLPELEKAIPAEAPLSISADATPAAAKNSEQHGIPLTASAATKSQSSAAAPQPDRGKEPPGPVPDLLGRVLPSNSPSGESR
jgi:hypothetical protein